MPEREQGRLIGELGQRAESHGYSGLLLRTEEGRPVAQWLSQRGHQLILTDERPPMPLIGG